MFNENDLSLNDLSLALQLLGKLVSSSHKVFPLKICNYPDYTNHIRKCGICSNKFKRVFGEILETPQQKGGE